MKEKTKASGTHLPMDRLENFLAKNQRIIFWLFFALGTLLVILNFDAKISTANDDAMYIQGGYSFVHKFPDYFYSDNAPLYVMFLAFVVLLFGLNIVLMKIFSVIFFLLSLYFFYRALKSRVPYAILFPALFVAATNPVALTYASLTFTEAFYMMLQALFMWLFFRWQQKTEVNKEDIKTDWKQWLFMGFMLFVLYMTKNVGLGAMIVVCAYYLIYRRYKSLLFTVGAFIVIALFFEYGVKRAVWGNVSQFSNQGSAIFQKDYYDASKGQEDLGGFVERFYTNAEIYLGSRFWEIIEVREESYELSIFFTFLTIALLVFGFMHAWKAKNRTLIFISLYVAVLLAITFIALHTNWAQARLVMIFVPYMLAIILFGFYRYIRVKNLQFLQTGYVVVAGLLMALGFFASMKKAGSNIPLLSKNLRGDMYSGYTPDWQNFLKMSEWVGDNLPDTALAASRKQPMSFVYGGGREFFPIYKVLYNDPDSLLNNLREHKVTHVIVASLRVNPAVADGNVISTVRRYLYLIAQKYPDAFVQVHQVGEMEPAYLYAIDYKAVDRRRQSQPKK